MKTKDFGSVCMCCWKKCGCLCVYCVGIFKREKLDKFVLCLKSKWISNWRGLHRWAWWKKNCKTGKCIYCWSKIVTLRMPTLLLYCVFVLKIVCNTVYCIFLCIFFIFKKRFFFCLCVCLGKHLPIFFIEKCQLKWQNI